MKILYIVPSLVQLGPIVVVNDLVTLMVANSHECEVYYFDEKEKPMAFECPVKQISAKHAVDFSNYNIVHSHGFRPDSFVAKFREYSGNVRYITTLHNYLFQDLSFKYNWFIAQIYGRIWIEKISKFDSIIALSKDARAYYCRLIKDNHRITYAYNTRIVDTANQLPIDKLAELISFKADSILIGINASITKRKGIDIVIKHLDQLPNCKLFIVGDGKSKQEFEALATKRNVIDRCYFAGFCKDAYRYLPYYDIYALPSRSEGFPLALLEAAAFAKRCIVSNIPIIVETFTKDEVAFFDLQNPKTFLSAIKSATEQDSLSNSILQKYNQEYSPTQFYNRHISIYTLVK